MGRVEIVQAATIRYPTKGKDRDPHSGGYDPTRGGGPAQIYTRICSCNHLSTPEGIHFPVEHCDHPRASLRQGCGPAPVSAGSAGTDQSIGANHSAPSGPSPVGTGVQADTGVESAGSPDSARLICFPGQTRDSAAAPSGQTPIQRGDC